MCYDSSAKKEGIKMKNIKFYRNYWQKKLEVLEEEKTKTKNRMNFFGGFVGIAGCLLEGVGLLTFVWNNSIPFLIMGLLSAGLTITGCIYIEKKKQEKLYQFDKKINKISEEYTILEDLYQQEKEEVKKEEIKPAIKKSNEELRIPIPPYPINSMNLERNRIKTR